MKAKRILIASPFFPYPPSFGGVYDIYGRIKELYKLGYNIDLVYTDKEKPKPENIEFLQQFINEFYFVSRQNRIFHLFSLKPLQVLSRKGLRDIELNHNYDLLIVENDSASEIINNASLKTEKIALRVQNNESVYFNNLGRSISTPLKKAYYYSESVKFYKYSRRLFKIVDRIWFISSDEYLENKKINSLENGSHLPSPINLNDFKKNNLKTNNVLFVGAMFMPNNIEAIEWYLKNIHEDVSRDFPKYKFIIAGSTGRYSKAYYEEKFSTYKNIELYFDLESLDEVYEKSSVFVNPMQHGAGVKIKSIHSMMNGLPLVSTKIGSEGIGLTDGENFIKGETKEKFTIGVKTLLNNSLLRKRIAESGQSFLKNNNSEKILDHELSRLFK